MLLGADCFEVVDVDVVSVDVEFVECVVWVVVLVDANLHNWYEKLAFGDPQCASAKRRTQLHVGLPSLGFDKVLLDFGPKCSYPLFLQPNGKRGVRMHSDEPRGVVLRTFPLDLEVPQMVENHLCV